MKFLKAFKKHIVRNIILCVCALILIAAGTAASLLASDIYGWGRKSEAAVEIPMGSSAAQIGTILKNKGLIKYPQIFSWYVKQHNLGSSLQYGEMTISGGGYASIINQIKNHKNLKDTIKFTIPEGWWQTQIVDELVKKGIGTKEEIEAAMNPALYDYDFLNDLPKRSNALEGYLFPDTYEIFTTDDVQTVVKKMLNNFNKKITASGVREKASAMGMTLDEFMRLASIVQSETGNKNDMPLVSSVFHNRIKKSWMLESCVTVMYALGYHKTVLLNKDLLIESPYNTYKYEGLPPGPICNPGLDAIKATLNPATSDYMFFCAGNGKTYFAVTNAQHEANKKLAGITK